MVADPDIHRFGVTSGLGVTRPEPRLSALNAIKPKKRENRVGDLAGLPYAGMLPRFRPIESVCVQRSAIIT
jgi:hypothetical protein